MASRAGLPAMIAKRRWHVYLVLCRNGSIYTGIALDVDARYAKHVSGRGARYTRANPPAAMLARFACRDRNEAARLEYAIKQLAPGEKRRIAQASAAELRALLINRG
jgi:putative endonuclease